MSLARDDLARRALDRVRAHSASTLIEPGPAYEVSDRGDHVRLVSGADALEPGMVWMDGADNVLITGFNAKVRRHCAFRVRGRGNVIFFGAYSQVASTSVVIEGTTTSCLSAPSRPAAARRFASPATASTFL